MAFDIEELRRIARTSETINIQPLKLQDILATRSIYKIVGYFQQEAPISIQEAQNYLKENINKMLLWTLLYSILSGIFVFLAILFGVFIFGFSTDAPSWSRWIKIPIMFFVVSLILNFYLLPIAVVLAFLTVFFSGLYLVWGSLENNHRLISKIWCFMPDVIKELSS